MKILFIFYSSLIDFLLQKSSYQGQIYRRKMIDQRIKIDKKALKLTF